MVDYKTDQKKKMIAWWQGALAQSVCQAEQTVLNNNANYFFGDIQLQMGLHQNLLPENTPARMQSHLASDGDICGCFEALPIRSMSVDNLLIAHVLEFSDDPHQVLREAERVLVDDGVLVLCQFNPWSLWGLKRWLSWQDNPPWQGQFFSLSRIKDWLALLSFEVVKVERLVFRPPMRSTSWFQRFGFLERWGRRLWPFFSGVTVIIASKRTIPVTPIRSRWNAPQLFPSGQFINKPVIRENKDG